MGKIIVLSIFVVFLFSRTKEKDTTLSSTLTLTGTWNMTFTTGSNNTYSGPMVITQHSDNSLSGTFDWGGGHYTLDATSIVNGNKVTIDWQGNMRFSGTVTTAFDYMTGDISVLDLVSNKYNPYGTWSAIKSSK